MNDRAVVTGFQHEGHNHQNCQDEALSRADAVCKARGVRLTALRRRVLELVWTSHEPVKAYELLERLRTERANVTPPTVYRALEFLLAQGLVHRLESLNAYLGCGAPQHEHPAQFLICERCQAVAELSDADISATIDRKARELGFRMAQQTIEITGLCPACSV
ncbi:Fur family transcriptional regulator [Desulfurivibrio alkaliphilus]|uniref:Ferric uptake regulator, Fur family n=1 Tax=Desulfurivibrio alkaliphilus (strain DSM 19089 / UNIQEM U267 / AHT2) TaxID=589865 RepID=D6Z136_DESAT|nr:Fur family transcriptional regulator [Desulfurivibrio alkaliphilus]ADH87296.1 ferric uptake regulator, Fur family [Desulfurivibrio alkaliphilus AHT 2]